MNIAALQGMVDALCETGPGPSGIYSTAYKWSQVARLTGTPSDEASAGTLWGLPVWIPGARKESGAQDNCLQVALTGGIGIRHTHPMVRPPLRPERLLRRLGRVGSPYSHCTVPSLAS